MVFTVEYKGLTGWVPYGWGWEDWDQAWEEAAVCRQRYGLPVRIVHDVPFGWATMQC